MRVLVVNETSDLGGAETMALELANALGQAPGVSAALAAAPGRLTERLAPGVPFYPLSRFRASRVPTILRELRAILREARPDVVHPQGATVGLLAGIAARSVSPAPRVVITHHSAAFARLPARLAHLALSWAGHALVAISRAKEASLLRAGVPREKVVLIPNFVHRERLRARASGQAIERLRGELGVAGGERVVVGAGRLVPEKRFDLFVSALSECAAREPGLRILGLLLGDGPERQRLQRMADEAARGNLRLRLMGYQDDVPAYLGLADAFLFPSEWREVLPMCLIEAISLGVPVVCSDIPGNNDIVEDGASGLLVDPATRDYAGALLRLLGDRELARRLSAGGAEKARRVYDRDKVVGDLLGLYGRLAAAR